MPHFVIKTRILALSAIFFAMGCAPQISTHSEIEATQNALSHPFRIHVYMREALPEMDCAMILANENPRSELGAALVYNSLAEFETYGFASIQIDHVAASKKMLVVVLAIDRDSDQIVSHACLDSIEVEKNALRDVHLVLSSTFSPGDQNE